MTNQTNFERVRAFNAAFRVPMHETPTLLAPDAEDLCFDLISEECQELEMASLARDIVEIADALTDILYVVYGMGAKMGIDLDATFREVHRSNMSKLGPDGQPIFRSDGKVLKGPDYSPPDLLPLLQTKDT